MFGKIDIASSNPNPNADPQDARSSMTKVYMVDLIKMIRHISQTKLDINQRASSFSVYGPTMCNRSLSAPSPVNYTENIQV